MRGFAFGLLVVIGVAVTVLSIRPGGLRRQLRLAGRRLRIVLVLGGVWILGSLIVRVVFPTGLVADYGPAVIAIVLGGVFMFVAQDADTPNAPSTPGSRKS